MPISESITIPYKYKRPLPDFQNGEDIKFPDTLVELLLDKFTKPNDVVLDPFSGLGTTFFVCEDKNRVPFGIEADEQRYQWVKNKIKSKNNLYLGDSGKISSYNFPQVDFSVTSPPYMPHWHRWNPLYNGDKKFDGYDIYLKRMQQIYSQICKLMKPNAYLIVQADNLTNEYFSPLVWNLGKALSDVMILEGEIIVHWSENTENDNKFTQCLVFRNA